MEFLKQTEYWTYQLPEWDNHIKDDIDQVLEKTDSITNINYTITSEVDLWTIEYKNREFTIASDISHGCEIRATHEEDLPLMEKLIKNLEL